MTRTPLQPSPTRALSRRFAVLFALLWPFAGAAAGAGPATPTDRLFRRADAANRAFIRGDMRAWIDLVRPIGQDFTLMQPFGGPTSHGFDDSDAHLDQLAAYFRDGVGQSELVQSYAVDDMVVLVMIERQSGEVGDLPAQDWSLRVTQIYQRRNGAWELIHRHADPLVRNIGLARAAELARGS